MYAGIDLSLTNTGLIIIDEAGDIIIQKSIKTSAPDDKTSIGTIRRIEGIKRSVMKELLRNNVTKIAVEGFSYGSKGRALFQIAYLGYSIREELWKADIDFIEPAPKSLKQYVTGKGNSKKSEVMLQVYKKWGKEFSDDNLADAYTLAQMLKGLENKQGLNKCQLEILEKIEKVAK